MSSDLKFGIYTIFNEQYRFGIYMIFNEQYVISRITKAIFKASLFF